MVVHISISIKFNRINVTYRPIHISSDYLFIFSFLLNKITQQSLYLRRLRNILQTDNWGGTVFCVKLNRSCSKNTLWKTAV